MKANKATLDPFLDRLRKHTARLEASIHNIAESSAELQRIIEKSGTEPSEGDIALLGTPNRRALTMESEMLLGGDQNVDRMPGQSQTLSSEKNNGLFPYSSNPLRSAARTAASSTSSILLSEEAI